MQAKSFGFTLGAALLLLAAPIGYKFGQWYLTGAPAIIQMEQSVAATVREVPFTLYAPADRPPDLQLTDVLVQRPDIPEHLRAGLTLVQDGEWHVTTIYGEPPRQVWVYLSQRDIRTMYPVSKALANMQDTGETIPLRIGGQTVAASWWLPLDEASRHGSGAFLLNLDEVAMAVFWHGRSHEEVARFLASFVPLTVESEWVTELDAR
ncbi:MAG: hypothetical protein N2383_12620 [Caldilineales bacterium]|nr:hypothetical protein [Caldilineales bacterium]